MDAEQLVNIARNSLSDYCINTCKAKCCKKGKLVLSENEAKLLVKDIDKLEKKENGIYVLNIDKKNCPKLNNNMCGVYDRRPKTCGDFPLYLHGETLITANTCQAVNENVLNEFFERMKKVGIRIR